MRAQTFCRPIIKFFRIFTEFLRRILAKLCVHFPLFSKPGSGRLLAKSYLRKTVLLKKVEALGQISAHTQRSIEILNLTHFIAIQFIDR